MNAVDVEKINPSFTISAGTRASESGVLRGIAHRPVDGAAMQEVSECRLLPGRGMDTENRKPGKREITLISVDSWRDACRQLGADLPWPTRRANLLIEGIDLSAGIGKSLRISGVRIYIHGETKPCGLMDKQFTGLRAALAPAFRGGVYGEVLNEGVVRIGDVVSVPS